MKQVGIFKGRFDAKKWWSTVVHCGYDNGDLLNFGQGASGWLRRLTREKKKKEKKTFFLFFV